MGPLSLCCHNVEIIPRVSLLRQSFTWASFLLCPQCQCLWTYASLISTFSFWRSSVSRLVWKGTRWLSDVVSWSHLSSLASTLGQNGTEMVRCGFVHLFSGQVHSWFCIDYAFCKSINWKLKTCFGDILVWTSYLSKNNRHALNDWPFDATPPWVLHSFINYTRPVESPFWYEGY